MVRSWQLNFEQDQMSNSSHGQKFKQSYGFPGRKSFPEHFIDYNRPNLIRINSSDIRSTHRNSGGETVSNSRFSQFDDESHHGYRAENGNFRKYLSEERLYRDNKYKCKRELKCIKIYPEKNPWICERQMKNQSGKTEKRKLISLSENNNHYSSKMKDERYFRNRENGKVFPAKSTFKENERSPKDLRGFRFTKSERLESRKKSNSFNSDGNNELPDINVDGNNSSNHIGSSSNVYKQNEVVSKNMQSGEMREREEQGNDLDRFSDLREYRKSKSERPKSPKKKSKTFDIDRNHELPDINDDGNNHSTNISSSLNVHQMPGSMKSGETRERPENIINDKDNSAGVREFRRAKSEQLKSPKKKSNSFNSDENIELPDINVDGNNSSNNIGSSSNAYKQNDAVSENMQSGETRERPEKHVDVTDSSSAKRDVNSSKIDLNPKAKMSLKVAATIEKVLIEACSEETTKIFEEHNELNPLQTNSHKKERKSKLKTFPQVADQSKLSNHKKFKYSTKPVDNLKSDSCWVCHNNFTDPVDDDHLFFGEIKCKNCNLWIRSCAIYKGFLKGEIQNGCHDHSFKWSYIDTDNESDEYNILSMYLERIKHLKSIKFYKRPFKHFDAYFLKLHNTHSTKSFSSDENSVNHSTQSYQGPIKICISNIDGNTKSAFSITSPDTEKCFPIKETLHSASISELIEEIPESDYISNNELQEDNMQITNLNSSSRTSQEGYDLIQKLPSYARDNCRFTNTIRDCCMDCNKAWDLTEVVYIYSVKACLQPCNNCGIFTCFYLEIFL